MKIIKKEEIKQITVEPEDTITLWYHDEKGQKHIVLEEKINKKMKINEAIVFTIEKGDFFKNVKDGIGGALLETTNSS